MSKKRCFARIFLCIFPIVFLIIAGCTSSSDPTLSYSIEGYIIDGASDGVDGANVDLSGADNTIIVTTTTDENGRYIFNGLSNGLYTVTPSYYNCTFQVEINTFENAPYQDVTISGAGITCPNFVMTCP